MSLGSVQSLNNDFGYRQISYSGDVRNIAHSDISKLQAADTAEVAADFSIKTNRLADAGIFPRFMVPGQAGSLIVGGSAAEAEKILDVVFGVQAFDRTFRPAVHYERTPGQTVNVTMSFGSAARGEVVKAPPMALAFGKAAKDNVVHPAFGMDKPAADMALAA